MAFVYGCYYTGDYWSSTKRQHANQDVPNTFFSNRDFIMAKEAFLQNFVIFNRNFTGQELEHFNYQAALTPGKPRRHIYNPALHGDDKEAWEAKVAALKARKVGYGSLAFQDVLNKLNPKKLAHDLQIASKPYDLTQHIDPTGHLVGLKTVSLTRHGRALD